MKRFHPALAALLALAAGAAAAQTLYRWTDDKGRVHITDSPPPTGVKGVQKAGSSAAAGTASSAPVGQVPYELAIAMKEYPVTLYSTPTCKEGCSLARGVLNKRGIPFKEIVVQDEATNEELKKASGATEVPTIIVGKSVQRGFEETAYNELLDMARYPKAGILPVRSQAAPPPPDATPKAEAEKAAPPAPKMGAYAPKAPKKAEPEQARPYAPIPGKDAPRTGPYQKVPGEPEEKK